MRRLLETPFGKGDQSSIEGEVGGADYRYNQSGVLSRRLGGIMQMKWQDYISTDPLVCHGRACITGTRVMVTVILDSLAEGLGVEKVVTHYPSVSREAVQATLLYAAELANP